VPLLGKRAERLDEKVDLLGLDRELSLLRPHHRPFDGDPVADVEVLLQRPLALGERVFLDVDLDLARELGEDEERRLAEVADRHDPAGDGDALGRRVELLGGFRRVLRDDAGDGRVRVGAVRMARPAERLDARELLAAHAHELVFGLLRFLRGLLLVGHVSISAAWYFRGHRKRAL